MAKRGLRNLISLSLMIMMPNERACLLRIATHMKAYRNKVSTKIQKASFNMPSGIPKGAKPLGSLLLYIYLAPPYRNEFLVWEWSIWYATCWVGKIC